MPTPKIIFDTDIGWDCDDAGALGLLHRLCDQGEAELLATVHCYNHPYVAGCLDAINTYYGRPVPVGLNYDQPRNHPDTYAKALSETFENRYPAASVGTPEGPEDSLALLRRLLSEAEDASVTIVTVGDQANLARLVTSQPDEFSPLNGVDLITQKVARTVGHSQLVKTAMFGRDPNWGRIVAAAGRAGVDFDPMALRVTLCGVELFRDGRPTDLDFDALLEEPLNGVDLPLDIVMGDGPGESRLLASDLSHAYVTLNSDYRS